MHPITFFIPRHRLKKEQMLGAELDGTITHLQQKLKQVELDSISSFKSRAAIQKQYEEAKRIIQLQKRNNEGTVIQKSGNLNTLSVKIFAQKRLPYGQNPLPFLCLFQFPNRSNRKMSI